MSRRTQLEAAYKAVCEEINSAARKYNVPKPNLVAVSKYKPAEDIKVLYDLGHRQFGENYTAELAEKAKILPADIEWHFIGNLQSNKCKIVREVPNLQVLETLDSDSKATKLNAQREKLESPKPLQVYIQVNTSHEENKSGIVSEHDVVQLAKHIYSHCPLLELKGLMTIGSLSESKTPGENQDFKRLTHLRDTLEASLGLQGGTLGLSMGMSSDYIEALRQGSTSVRVGSAIFGERHLK